MAEPNAAPPPPGTGFEPPGREPSKLWLVIVVVLVVVVVVTAVGGRPVYWRIKRAQGVGLAHAAGELMAADRTTEAGRKIQTALRFAPGDPEVSRTAARYCAKVGLPEGLNYWATVLASPQATRADRLAAAEMAVDLGRVDLSGPWLQAAYKEQSHDLSVLRLMFRHLQRLGDRPRTLKFARGFLKEFPAEPEAELALGGLLLREIAIGDRAEGRRLLWGLAAGTSRFRDPAVQTLISSHELGRGELELLARTLDAQTNATLLSRLQAIDLRVRIDPARRPASVQKAVALVKPEADPEDLALVGRWLNRQGAATEVLALLPTSRCMTNAGLMAPRLEALMALNRADEVGKMVTAKGGPLEGPLLAAAQGVLAARSGRKVEAGRAFHEALQMGARFPAVLPFVAKQAEAAGLPLVAIEAYQMLLELPDWTLDAARQILRLVKPMDDLTVAQVTLRRLNAFMPGEDSVAGDRAWLETLFGENGDWALTTFERLVQLRPNQLDWRFGLALAKWRKGEMAAALNLIEQSGLKWEKLEPRWQAVYIVVLGANQQREAARRFARQLSLDKLRLQEKTLIAPWL